MSNRYNIKNPNRNKERDNYINILIKTTDSLSQVFEYCIKNNELDSATEIQMSASILNNVIDAFIKAQNDADKEFDEFVNSLKIYNGSGEEVSNG